MKTEFTHNGTRYEPGQTLAAKPHAAMAATRSAPFIANGPAGRSAKPTAHGSTTAKHGTRSAQQKNRLLKPFKHPQPKEPQP
jgi:hypothetical protein